MGIVGGGYIGVEMAEALAANGFEVHLFQRGDRTLRQFSEATSEVVLDHLGEQHVAVYLGAKARELTGDDAVEAVVTDDERVPVKMVLVGTGIRPRTDLAEDPWIVGLRRKFVRRQECQNQKDGRRRLRSPY